MVIVSIPPEIIQPPTSTSGNLHSTVNLTCRATGNPIPTILWYKNNVLISNDNNNSSVLMFTELNLNDRGFYHCEARSIIDGHITSVNSSSVILIISSILLSISYTIHLTINTDIVQYETELQLSKKISKETNLICQVLGLYIIT